MALGLCFTACSDDEETEVLVTDSLVGEYVGIRTCDMKNGPSQKFGYVSKVIKAAESGKYIVVLPEPSAETPATVEEDARHGKMPSISLENVEFTTTDNETFSFEVAEYVMTTDEMTVTVSDVEGTISKGVMNVKYVSQPKGMPFSLKYRFEGDANKAYVPMPAFAANVLGNYKGMYAMAVGGRPQTDKASYTSVIGLNNGKFGIMIPAIGSGKMNTPAFTINDVEFTENADKTYTASVASTEIKTEAYTIKIANLKVNISGDDMEVSYEMTPGSMPMPINCSVFANKKGLVRLGRFEGETSTTVMGETDTHAAFMDLYSEADSKIAIRLPENILAEGEKPGMALPGNIVIKGIALTKESETVSTFASDKIEFTVGEKKGTVSKLSGKLTNNKQVELSYEVKYGAMPFAIAYSFKGNIK